MNRRMLFLPLILLAAAACNDPVEPSLLPSPLHELRFGQSMAAVQGHRPAAKAGDCPSSFEGSAKMCLLETEPVAPFKRAVYRFVHDRLISIRLEAPDSPWEGRQALMDLSPSRVRSQRPFVGFLGGTERSVDFAVDWVVNPAGGVFQRPDVTVRLEARLVGDLQPGTVTDSSGVLRTGTALTISDREARIELPDAEFADPQDMWNRVGSFVERMRNRAAR